MKQSCRLVALLFGVLVIAAFPAQAQQPAGAPADSAVANSPLVDSLQAALNRFKTASSPTATDSTALRQWADSTLATGQSLRKRDPSRSRPLLQNALSASQALADSARTADALLSIGITHQIQGHNERATTQFRQALRIYRTTNHRNGEATALDKLGLVYRGEGRYEMALRYHEKALSIYRELGNRSGASRALNNLGNIQRTQGRYRKALQRYQDAFEILTKSDNRRAAITALSNIGLVQNDLGRYSEALQTYQKTLQAYRELSIPKGEARVLLNMGNTLGRQGQYENATAHFRDALRIFREIENKRGEATALLNLGEAQRRQGHYQEALSFFKDASSIYSRIGQFSLMTINKKYMGAAYLGQGSPKTAADTLNQAVTLAEKLRQRTTSPAARRSLLTTQIDAYQSLTTAYLRSNQPDSALRSVEQARARLLADRLAGTAQADSTFKIPSVATLRSTLGPDEAALLYANAGTEWPLTALTVTSDTTIARELPDSTVRASLQQTYASQLNRLRRTEGPLDQALNSGSATDSTAGLASAIRLYRYYLTRGNTGTSIQNDLARRLHALLIAPVEEHIQKKEEVTVVPTSVLGYLPFETLRDSTGTFLVEDKHVRYAHSLTILHQLDQRDYGRRPRSLLAVGGANYTPDQPTEEETLVAEARGGSTGVATESHASALLRDAERRMSRGQSPRSTYQRLGYRTWTNLPDTKKEVNHLGQRAGQSATVLTGSSASEDTVRALSERGRLRKYRRVHFATHGVAVPEAPALSALVLSQVGASDSLAARDGYLTMDEIAELDLKADVAVLSACQTGLGRIIAGEGVVSLSHAFLRAGTNATLVSQWKVLDESTRQFMTAVYESAKSDDTSFAEAVSKTKRAFIEGKYGEKNTDPLRWAPFVYYGRE